MKHTPGAIKAAEIITGLKYGDKKLVLTDYGKKTVAGIADIIDNETAAPELLEACKAARAIIASSCIEEKETFLLLHNAILRAEGKEA